MFSQRQILTKNLKNSQFKNQTRKNSKKSIQIFNKSKLLMRMIPKKLLKISLMLRLRKVRRRTKNFLKTR